MKTHIGTLIVWLLLTGEGIAQTVVIRCSIQNRLTRQPLVGAYVDCVKQRRATQSDEEGQAQLEKVTPGLIDLSVRHVGYLVYRVRFVARRDTTLTIPMIEFVQELAEVSVSAQQPDKVTPPGHITFSQRALQLLPSIGGEHDVNRTLTLMPGVKLNNEGNAGLYVRGGSADQNLYSLNQVPLYKYSHFFGFLSPINSDVVQQVDFYKSGFPARYGGRLSSFLDVTLRTPSLQHLKVEGSIGLLSSRLSIDLPIIRNRLALQVAARRSYFDIFSRFFQGSGTTSGPFYTFYDLNASLLARLGQSTQLTLFAYRGQDRLQAGAVNDLENLQFDQRWLSNLAGLRAVTQLTPRLQTMLEANLSNYNLKQLTDQQQQTIATQYRFANVVKTLTLRNTLTLAMPHSAILRLGGQAVRYQLEPGNLTFSGINQAINASLDSAQFNELTGFIDHERRGKYVQANLGLRLSRYATPNRNYGFAEPRLRLSVRMDSLSHVNFSYDRTNQVLQLLNNTGFGPPIELWFPSGTSVRPQSAHQLAAGYSRSVPVRCGQSITVSLDAYWKSLANIIAYRDGYSAQDFTTFSQTNNRSWEQLVTSGNGRAYGLELLLQKRTGRLTGWLGYTLSWVRHQFAELNNGQPFYAQPDRRHDLSLALVYQLSQRWQLSSNWIYQSGQPITLPQAVYASPQVDFSTGHFADYSPNLVVYGERNSFRMRPTHRLDLSLQRKTTHRWGIGVFDISVYNLYNRQNPYYYYLAMGNKLKAVSLFSLIPSLSYRFQIYTSPQ